MIRKNLDLVLPLTVFYVLIAVFCLFLATFVFQVGSLTQLHYLGAGLAAWTLCEYLMHRFVLHEPSHPRTIGEWHGHVFHHGAPKHRDEMVFPIRGSIPALMIFAILIAIVVRAWGAFFCVVPGFITGYLAYEWIHFGAHYHRTNNVLMKRVYLNHRRHHHLDSRRFYGTTTPLWDIVFRTGLRPGERRLP